MPSGIAAGSPMQPQLRGHPMLQRSHANAAQPPSLGCSRLPGAARVCSAVPVAAAGSGSGISSQAAGQALPNMLAFASAAVKAWLPAYAAVKAWLLAGGWLVALKLAAASAAVFFVLDSSAKAEFDRQCKHDEVGWARDASACTWPGRGMLLLGHGLPLVAGARCNVASCGHPSLPPPCSLPNVPQPSTVVKKVNAEFERLLLRVPDHLAIMVWTHVLCGVVLSGMTFVPAPHEAVLLWLGSGALSEAHEIIRAYRMLRHGKASVSGQQPSMP